MKNDLKKILENEKRKDKGIKKRDRKNNECHIIRKKKGQTW